MALANREWGLQYDFFGAINASVAAANTITLNYTPNYYDSTLFAAFTHNSLTSGTMATPSGWTLLGSQSFATGNRVTLLYAKVSGSTAASSVTGTMSAATGFAASVVEVGGVARTPSLAAALTSNVGTSSGTAAAFNLAGAGGTAFPNPNVSPYLFVSAVGANQSLASASPQLIAQGPSPNWSVSLSSGVANSTSIALGVGMATVSHSATASYWGFNASRTCGVVTAIVPVFGRSGLASLGAGT
jgi:hypothetical protein